MKTIHDIRRENLAFAIANYFKNARQMALEIGVSPNSVSRVFAKNEANRRNVGDEMARAVEAAANLPAGWMDTQHKTESAAYLASNTAFADEELLALFSSISDEGLENAIDALSYSLPAKDAMKLAMILLSRVESDL